ncbi:MAG: N-acetylmuramic acid 6-phosphate etherase [Planctomycetota bacterium]|nr:N-acetylmuramic acid 6-phosphate etherase [Planctomycetota bacterium]
MNREQATMLEHLTTEARNPASTKIDTLTAIEIVRLMNEEDATIADAVSKVASEIAQSIDLIVRQFQAGGRLIYMGAGTSGRLGVLDASECPPTFSTNPEMVVGLIAGGFDALTRAVEGAEDHPELGEKDLKGIGFSSRDILVGIATSGRTPYVIGGLRYAKQMGAPTIGFCCNPSSQLQDYCQIMIAPIVGAEVISGSTRMKAGTATKMVLNMLTTGAMVRLGKTYGNLMVDLKATNHKLMDRSARIVSEITGLKDSQSRDLLGQCDNEVKTAIVANLLSISAQSAREKLQRTDGHLRNALESAS